jgi:hypothetical protein
MWCFLFIHHHFAILPSFQPHCVSIVQYIAVMSLPSPSPATGSQPPVDPRVLQAMEAPLIDLVKKSGGDLRTLLYAFFSFLHRRTDFYVVMDEDPAVKTMGFREGDAEKLLLAAFRQFPLRQIKGAPPASTVSSSSGQSPKKKDDAAQEMEIERKSLEEKSDNVAKKATAPSTADEIASAKPRLTEEGLQIPEGNGGVTDTYRWTQTLEETTVVLAVPEGTRGKDLDVTLKSTFASAKMKTPLAGEDQPKTLLEGTLVDKINVGESTWSLEGGALLLVLQKTKPTWWETVLEGDPKIDTSLVDSTRRIDSYDESTQAAIRKILFDQRQQRLGLPTSDEILCEKGEKPPMPPMPPGVEYIDKDTLDKAEKNK